MICIVRWVSLSLISACLFVAACTPSPDLNPHIEAIQLLYEEQEKGIEPYAVRILITPEYARIDDGYDQSDYVLFDRPAGTIFSVNHGEKNILVIGSAPPRESPGTDVSLGQEPIKDPEAPPVAGKQPVHFRFTADGEVCIEAVVIPGLLPDATQALIEYGIILAGQADLNKTPVELQTPCFLARYVLAPARQFEQGLPIEEWDHTGYRRILRDFTEAGKLPASLFELPDEYERHQLSES